MQLDLNFSYIFCHVTEMNNIEDRGIFIVTESCIFRPSKIDSQRGQQCS